MHEPTYPNTKWSTAPGDETLGGDLGDTVVSDGVRTISLANGDGNTAITNSQTSAGAVTMKISYSTSGDPGLDGTGNSAKWFRDIPTKLSILYEWNSLYEIPSSLRQEVETEQVQQPYHLRIME